MLARLVLLVVLSVVIPRTVAAGPPGPGAFTLQGQLRQDGAPVTGPVDLRFLLYDALVDGDQVGETLVAPAFGDFDDEGRFTVDLDFGPDAFPGGPRWLEIQVGDTVLSPRQPIMPAPYAMRALAVTAVADGALSGMYSNPIALSNPANAFSGSGAGLTDLSAAAITTGILGGAHLAGAYHQALSLTNVNNVFAGDGFALTGLNAAALTGVLPDGALAGAYSGAVSFTNPANSFAGSGAGLTALDAGHITTGVLTEARLPATLVDRLPTVIPGDAVALASIGPGGNHVGAMAIAGPYAAISRDGPAPGDPRFVVYDMTDPSSPVQLGSIASAMHARAAAALTESLIAVLHAGNVVRLFDISNPAAPALVATQTLGASPMMMLRTCMAADGVLYLLDDSAGTVVSFALTAQPEPLQLINWAQTTSGPRALAWTGTDCCVVTAAGRLEVYRTQDLTPMSVTQIVGSPVAIAARGGYVFVLSENPDVLLTFKIAVDGVPISIGQVPVEPGSQHIAVGGNIAAVVSADALRLQVFEVSVASLAAPVLLDSVPVSASPRTLAMDADTIYLAGGPASFLRTFGLDPVLRFTAPVLASAGLSGSGTALTGLNASSLASGTVGGGRLSGTYGNALSFTNAGNTFAGDGGGLTGLDASGVSAGTLSDARLSANVALLSGAQTFSGAKTFSNAGNVFTGSGAGLTSLNAASVSSGTLNAARLPASGNWQPSSTVSIAGSAFAVSPSSGGRVGVGTTSPLLPMDVHALGNHVARLLSPSTIGTWLSLANTSTGGNHWRIISSGQANGEGSGHLLFAHSPDLNDGVATRVVMRSDGTVGIATAEPLFTLHVNGSAGKPGGGSWSTASDARLKHRVEPLRGMLDRLLRLQGVSFEYIDPDAVSELHGTRTGLLAQDVAQVFPDWVEKGADGFLRLTIRGFEAIMVEATRELRAEKDAEISALHERIDRLEALVRRLAGAAGIGGAR